MQSYLIYGANGYTGELIARAAKLAGHNPVLAARREASVRPLAEELGFSFRTFALDDQRALDAGLDYMPLVLNCAGPFSQTAQAMTDACLRKRAHYLDITGEYRVFEALAARSVEARQLGVMLLPGVGFDVVPTDCLGAHLKSLLPEATKLRLGVQLRMDLSRGTATTTIEGFGRPNLVRRNGALTPLPLGALARTIDFGGGPSRAVAIPWGDVSTAYYSTGIPDIEVYVATTETVRVALRATALLAPVLQSAPVQTFLKKQVQRRPAGPGEQERVNGSARVWGEASNGTRTVVSRLRTPEPYHLTVATALASIERILRDGAKPGFQTPSLAFGPDFILSFPNVERFDN